MCSSLPFFVPRAVLNRRSKRYPPHTYPHDSRTDTILEKWRNEPATQEQLHKNVMAVLTDIFEKGEEVPLVVSAVAYLGVPHEAISEALPANGAPTSAHARS
jgi:hypothetical protein